MVAAKRGTLIIRFYARPSRILAIGITTAPGAYQLATGADRHEGREPSIHQTGDHSDAEAAGRQKVRRTVAASLRRSILHA
jgi:hypothetical protein